MAKGDMQAKLVDWGVSYQREDGKATVEAMVALWIELPDGSLSTIESIPVSVSFPIGNFNDWVAPVRDAIIAAAEQRSPRVASLTPDPTTGKKVK